MTFVRLPADHPVADFAEKLRERLTPAPGREVVLDEERHAYTVGGVPVPSVTDLRRGPGAESSDYDFGNREAMARGTAVHALVADIERARFMPWDVPVEDVYAPFVEVWLAFRDAVGWVTLAVEHSLEGVLWTPCPRCRAQLCIHREPEGWRYAGTPDMIGVMLKPPRWYRPGWIWVVDLKTGKAMPASVGQQIAAYVEAVRAAVGDLAPACGAGLLLKGDGSQLDAKGHLRLSRPRTKADGELYQGHDEVPLRGTWRDHRADDREDFIASAATYFGAQGGDAIGRTDDNPLAVEGGVGASLPLPSSLPDRCPPNVRDALGDSKGCH
jgi:hypothetical protein